MEKAIILGESVRHVIRQIMFENREVEPKKFETVDEVLQEPHFKNLVSSKIAELKDERLSMGGESELKADAGSYLIKNKLFNTQSVIDIYLEVVYKKSQYPSSVREYVKAICLPCLQETVKFYENPKEYAISHKQI